ncbi:MAG: transketolase C-terminal domain-containing protein [Flavobacteriales bacterium]
MTEWKTPFKEIKVGTGRKLRSGTDIAVLSIGHIGNIAAKGIESLQAEGYSVAHYDMRFAKPIDEMLLHEVFAKFKHVITIEDHAIMGGMGSAVLEFMGDHGYSAAEAFGHPRSLDRARIQQELYAECGFDDVALIAAVKELLAEQKGAKGKRASA